ncbi:MAG: sugar transferase [Sphingomonas sp.]|jgi:lipopolysaccharide/colanic/teichoic acid biosynthesis glycosyltransferase
MNMASPPPLAAAGEAGFNMQRMAVNRATVRMAMYLGLVLCDVAAIRGGFELGVAVRGIQWMSPNGVELGWLILPVHIVLAARSGAYSRTALESANESIRRGLSSFFFAVCIIALLVFYQHGGMLVSRLGHFVAMTCGLVFIALARGLFHLCFVWGRTDNLIGRLVILDGVPPFPTKDRVFDAAALGLAPDLRNPNILRQVAELIAPYDRVIVATTTARQHEWAVMLKAYNTTGEIMVEGGTMLGAIGVSRYRGADTVIVARGPMSLANRVKKRAVDLLVSAPLLLLLAPLLIAVAIAIKIDSRGPVLFAQTRVGRGNKWFKILKFRSMRVESSDKDGAQSTHREDDRITRVGRFIRRTSIDELPQLLNVLSGDMSIVGPRPHALGSLAGDKLFWEVSERYWLRHTIKPGITGLAQVRGFRGATERQSDLENRLQSDLEYVNGWGLWRDISIMFGTLRVLVHPRAY